MVMKSFNRLREAGFDNINLDLMFAIPGQTMEIWKSTMEEAIALGSEHLSCYEVIYEEDQDVRDMIGRLARPFLFLSLGVPSSWRRGFVLVRMFLWPYLGCRHMGFSQPPTYQLFL